jgi:hypothetical protein
MNIAFFGSSLVSAYWNGAATYYRGIIRALHELGLALRSTNPMLTIGKNTATFPIQTGRVSSSIRLMARRTF